MTSYDVASTIHQSPNPGFMSHMTSHDVARTIHQSPPSSHMAPPLGSTSRQSATMRVLLPLPVRPQMPTFSPACTLKLTPFT